MPDKRLEVILLFAINPLEAQIRTEGPADDVGAPKNKRIDFGSFFVFLNSYRWLNWVLAIVLLVAKVTPPTPVAVTIAVYSIVFVYNFIFTWRSRDIEKMLRRYPVLISVDILFCFVIVFVYGWRSPFTAYGFSPVMMAGFLLGVEGGFVAAAVCGAGYALSVALKGPAWAKVVQMGLLDQELFQVFDYFLVAIFFSYPASLAEKLRRSNNELVAAQAEVERLTLAKERERLAGDIHDSVTQSLLSIDMLLGDSIKAVKDDEQMSKRLGLAKEAAQKARDEIRSAIDDLFDDRYSSKTLWELAERALTRVKQNHNLVGELILGGEEANLDPEAKKALFLILSEALSNCIKYARAARVDISLDFKAGVFTMEIVDDGEGFSDVEAKRGYGLRMISHRAEELKGACEIVSGLGQGTRVTVTIPLSRDTGLKSEAEPEATLP